MVHVLVVEDDEAIRLLLRWALEDNGYEVSEAANGKEALDDLRSSPVPVVAVLDIGMSPTNGIEVLKAVRAEATLSSRHCYIVETAVPLDRLEFPDDMTCLLAVPPIRKPFDLDNFLGAVAQAAGKLPTSQPGSGVPPFADSAKSSATIHHNGHRKEP